MKKARKAWELAATAYPAHLFKDMPNIDIYSEYYINTAYGGWNPSIQGNPNLRPFPGSVLPNCVGYTVGRFNQMLGEGACPWLGPMDARDQLANAQSQGLQTGDDAVVGGVICWWSANNGHCAVIEEVIDPDTVRTSESGWNYPGPDLITEHTRYRVNGEWVYGSGYIYQGVIYPPVNNWYAALIAILRRRKRRWKT